MNMNINNYREKQIKVINYFNKNHYLIITYFISFFSLCESFFSGNQRKYYALGLFTKQNALLINLLLFLSLNHKFRTSKGYSYLSFVCLINCLTVIFFCLLEKKKDNIIFWEHKVLTSFFVLYYFFANSSSINIKKFYIGLIYPLIYFFITLIIAINDKLQYPYYNNMQTILNNPNPQIIFLLTIVFLIVLVIFMYLCIFMLILKNNLIKNKYNVAYVQTHKRRFYLAITLFLLFSFILFYS